jgi:hypothetical protein
LLKDEGRFPALLESVFLNGLSDDFLLPENDPPPLFVREEPLLPEAESELRLAIWLLFL